MQRVVDFKVQCSKCSVPEYYEPQPFEEITFITNAFLAGGGDGYDMLPDHPNREYLGNFCLFRNSKNKNNIPLFLIAGTGKLIYTSVNPR